MIHETLKTAVAFGLAATIGIHQPAVAQGCVDDAMIVFDGSGSMSEMGFNRLDLPRIFEARQAVRLAMPKVAPLRRIGLIVYGPGGGDSCRNINLRLRPVADAGDAIIAAIDALEPDGETALTDAVARAAQVLDPRDGVVVLITDGDETCGGSPCLLAAELAAERPLLTVHVVGFRVRDAHFNWQDQGDDTYVARDSKARCLADRTGGGYFAAESVNDLATALQQTLGCQVFGLGVARSAQGQG